MTSMAKLLLWRETSILVGGVRPSEKFLARGEGRERDVTPLASEVVLLHGH